MNAVENPQKTYWFVGASYGGGDDARYGGTEDQTPRFLEEGIWENGHEKRFHNAVRSMQPGERIAIKASYVRRRKEDLPFDNRGASVAVMAIKATGTITENPGDGKRVRVDWDKQASLREWYFYTSLWTVWKVVPEDSWEKEELVAFAFGGKPQDIDRFRNHPNWRKRHGTNMERERFPWTQFYEAIAEKLLDYRDDRKPLIEGIHEIALGTSGLPLLEDILADGSRERMRDICPFTAMGIFNRRMYATDRKAIASEFASLLGVETPVPDEFNGIPTLHLRSPRFFRNAKDRNDGDIDALWRTFTAAADLVNSDSPEHRSEFIEAYDEAAKMPGILWKLSIGLHWAHPWDFAVLNSKARNYIKKRLNLEIPTSGERNSIDGEGYLQLLEKLKDRFEEDGSPVHNFPELSLEAGAYEDSDESDQQEDEEDQGEIIQPAPIPEQYSIDNILEDGCFLERDEIEKLLERLNARKNLILQGPPGTGKTWLAKRLAFALMGEKNNKRLRAVQFHPNLSYEDFVRGWRPASDSKGNGKLEIVEGTFMEAIKAALKNSKAKFVVVIEEINRGNPAQVFGELLTLLEAGKRDEKEALELCYPDPKAKGEKRPVYVPENLYVIGTMNIADRSLALVDLAFRRRFAFATLEPMLNDAWQRWVIKECGLDSKLVDGIKQRITELNQRISDDLGVQYRIGHSYVTPTHRIQDGATRDWFLQVVETEIGPLLHEYWFDAPKTAEEAIEKLGVGW